MDSSIPAVQDAGRRAASANAAAVCAQEQIHLLGTIQPHGVFLAADPARDLAVVAASRNAAEILGIPSLADGVTGRGIGGFLGPAFAAAAAQRFREGRLRGEAPWRSTLEIAGNPLTFDVSAHAHNGLIQVELERAAMQAGTDAQTTLHQLEEIVGELRGTGNDLDELARVAAHGLRRLTGYERVLIYRFDADWNGQSIAEDKVADWHQSFAGLRFPATDIPAQARELYRRSPMRWVANRDAVPTPLDVDPAWAGNQPPFPAIDLSFALLRSLSPVHLQIHRNLGIDGTMSMSILSRDRLWGLMMCHHRQPHQLSPSQRSAASALTGAFALRVGVAERADTEQARRGDLLRQSALLAQMAEADVVAAALTMGDVTIGDLFASTGAAVLYDGEISLVGLTPPEADIQDLAIWLRARAGAENLFHINNLAAAYPLIGPHHAIASGLLAVFLSADRRDMLLWFRPEEAELVSWGGSSRQSPEDEASSHPEHLAEPDHSFKRWNGMRRGVARPWAEWELEMAETLRHGITEVMVRALRRIADLNDKLRQSQKMEAVGQLTGGIAHDFNNLLTGIIGSLDVMQGRVAQGRTGGLDRYVGTAMTCATRAASLTHRLLAFSRRQMLDPKAVDVNRLTAAMAELVRRTVGPAIHLELALADHLWEALCDANQLESALLNLAINARDAMPDGGRLRIATANAVLEDASCPAEVAAGPYVTVSVTDSGTGMPPGVAARVFEPFFTTKPLGQGTGLGLSMVYGFTRQSNGDTQIDSEVGRGTTVRLYLPRAPILAETAVDIATLLPGILAATGETVMIVDDEPSIRMLVGDALRDQGFDVIEAADGPEGLRILQSEQVIDLMVTDIGLPGGMDGRQLASAATALRPSLKLLFITGYAEHAMLDDDGPGPERQVVLKPFTMDALTATIRKML